jgi:hypothetical protein
MNDFLHSLRNNNRRYDRNRKSYDNNSNYNHNDRRRPKDGNYRHQRKNVDQETLAEIREIKKNLQGMVANQAKLIDVIERIAVVLEQGRLTAATTAGATTDQGAAPSAKPSSQGDLAPFRAAKKSAAADDVDADGNHVGETDNRHHVITRINRLRAKGLSYEKIAYQLDSEKVPTLSGRGKWRGQSVYRLFQQQA